VKSLDGYKFDNGPGTIFAQHGSLPYFGSMCEGICKTCLIALVLTESIKTGWVFLSKEWMGSPIKGRVKRKNTSPMQKIYFFRWTLDGFTTARPCFSLFSHPLFLFYRFSVTYYEWGLNGLKPWSLIISLLCKLPTSLFELRRDETARQERHKKYCKWPRVRGKRSIYLDKKIDLFILLWTISVTNFILKYWQAVLFMILVIIFQLSSTNFFKPPALYFETSQVFSPNVT